MNKTNAGRALLVTSWMGLHGCGGSSTTAPPPPTTTPPTTTPITLPTPDPLIAACGTPRPPDLYGIKLKVQVDQGYRKLVDSRPIVKNVDGYCSKVGLGSGAYCDTRPEGDSQREACDALVIGRAKDTQRYGPTWLFEAKPCGESGAGGDGCVNNPDNQFLVVTRGEGEIMACAADDVPVAEGRCGTCQLIVGSSACQ
jgi:hypothetical protein